jgi:hypothetical protein
MRKILPILAVVVLLLGGLLYLGRVSTGGNATTLGTDLAPLREAFNRDAGAVRLLMVVDPT